MGQSGDNVLLSNATRVSSRPHYALRAPIFQFPANRSRCQYGSPSYFMGQIEMSRERGRPFNPLFPYLFAFIGGWYFWYSWLHMHIEGAVQSSVAPYKGQCTLALPVSSSSHPPPYQHHHHRSPFNTSNSLYNPLPTPLPSGRLNYDSCSIVPSAVIFPMCLFPVGTLQATAH